MTSAIGPGSIIVCVDASRIPRGYTQLIEGARYLVRAVVHDLCLMPPSNSRDGVLLRGIQHEPDRNNGKEPAYHLYRFRPIDDSDSEIFRSMVSDTKQKVSA